MRWYNLVGPLSLQGRSARPTNSFPIYPSSQLSLYLNSCGRSLPPRRLGDPRHAPTQMALAVLRVTDGAQRRGRGPRQRQAAHTRHHVACVTEAAGPPPAIHARPDQALAEVNALVNALRLHHAFKEKNYLLLATSGSRGRDNCAQRDSDTRWRRSAAQIDLCLDILQMAQINRSMNTANTWRAQSGVS